MRETIYGLLQIRPGLWLNWHEITSLQYYPAQDYHYPEPHLEPEKWRVIHGYGHVDILTVDEGETLQAYIQERSKEWLTRQEEDLNAQNLANFNKK